MKRTWLFHLPGSRPPQAPTDRGVPDAVAREGGGLSDADTPAPSAAPRSVGVAPCPVCGTTDPAARCQRGGCVPPPKRKHQRTQPGPPVSRPPAVPVQTRCACGRLAQPSSGKCVRCEGLEKRGLL